MQSIIKLTLRRDTAWSDERHHRRRIWNRSWATTMVPTFLVQARPCPARNCWADNSLHAVDDVFRVSILYDAVKRKVTLLIVVFHNFRWNRSTQGSSSIRIAKKRGNARITFGRIKRPFIHLRTTCRSCSRGAMGALVTFVSNNVIPLSAPLGKV